MRDLVRGRPVSTVRESLDMLERFTAEARAALEDEGEARFGAAVVVIGSIADDLRHLVATW